MAIQINRLTRFSSLLLLVALTLSACVGVTTPVDGSPVREAAREPSSHAAPVWTRAPTSPLTPAAWVLDYNMDEGKDFEHPATLTAINSAGDRLETFSLPVGTPYNSSNRHLMVAPDGRSAVFFDPLGITTLYDLDGPGWSTKQRFTAGDFLDDRYAYAVTSGEDVFGTKGTLAKLDMADGSILERAPFGGWDVVVDRASGASWVVGGAITKLNRELEQEWSLDPILWLAVSVDHASDGSVWVAEAEQDDIPHPEGQNRLYKISPAGEIVKTIELDARPSTVAVDRRDDSVWVSTSRADELRDGLAPGALHKFDREGKLLFTLDPGVLWTVRVSQADGAVWASRDRGVVVSYAPDGSLISWTENFLGYGNLAVP